MYCSNCADQIAETASFCGKCGQRVARASESATATSLPEPALEAARRSAPWVWVTVGFFGGAASGFVMRPSALLVGQLPFGMVITRGSSLTGLDQLLVPTAQQSFNVMLMAALVGAILGFALHRIAGVRQA